MTNICIYLYIEAHQAGFGQMRSEIEDYLQQNRSFNLNYYDIFNFDADIFYLTYGFEPAEAEEEYEVALIRQYNQNPYNRPLISKLIEDVSELLEKFTIFIEEYARMCYRHIANATAHAQYIRVEDRWLVMQRKILTDIAVKTGLEQFLVKLNTNRKNSSNEDSNLLKASIVAVCSICLIVALLILYIGKPLFTLEFYRNQFNRLRRQFLYQI